MKLLIERRKIINGSCKKKNSIWESVKENTGLPPFPGFSRKKNVHLS